MSKVHLDCDILVFSLQ